MNEVVSYGKWTHWPPCLLRMSTMLSWPFLQASCMAVPPRLSGSCNAHTEHSK